MKTVMLCSGELPSELECARMLELELSDKGYSVLRTDTSSDYAAEIIVFDTISEAEAERLGGAANEAGIPVICCANERIDTLPSGMIYFERPFDIKRFCDFITIITDKGRKEAQKQKGFAGDIVIDRKSKTVTCRGEKIELTAREYELLIYLDAHRGKPISREDAIRDVWEFGYTGDTNVVDVYIRYLRRKLDERFDAKFIATVRGKGYMLR